jgi:hypothetical protein
MLVIFHVASFGFYSWAIERWVSLPSRSECHPKGALPIAVFGAGEHRMEGLADGQVLGKGRIPTVIPLWR